MPKERKIKILHSDNLKMCPVIWILSRFNYTMTLSQKQVSYIVFCISWIYLYVIRLKSMAILELPDSWALSLHDENTYKKIVVFIWVIKSDA